jgi:hypothetical protein
MELTNGEPEAIPESRFAPFSPLSDHSSIVGGFAEQHGAGTQLDRVGVQKVLKACFKSMPRGSPQRYPSSLIAWRTPGFSEHARLLAQQKLSEFGRSVPKSRIAWRKTSLAYWE